MEWTITFRDLKLRIEQRVAAENVRAMQVYEAVAKVASDLFADPKKKGSDRPTFNEEDIPLNAEDAKRRFAELFGG